MYMGPSVLREAIENAELYPIRGLFSFTDYFFEIDSYYHRTTGYEFGVSTGWKALNNLYNVSKAFSFSVLLDYPFYFITSLCMLPLLIWTWIACWTNQTIVATFDYNSLVFEMIWVFSVIVPSSVIFTSLPPNMSLSQMIGLPEQFLLPNTDRVFFFLMCFMCLLEFIFVLVYCLYTSKQKEAIFNPKVVKLIGDGTFLSYIHTYLGFKFSWFLTLRGLNKKLNTVVISLSIKIGEFHVVTVLRMP